MGNEGIMQRQFVQAAAAVAPILRSAVGSAYLMEESTPARGFVHYSYDYQTPAVYCTDPTIIIHGWVQR